MRDQWYNSFLLSLRSFCGHFIFLTSRKTFLLSSLYPSSNIFHILISQFMTPLLYRLSSRLRLRLVRWRGSSSTYLRKISMFMASFGSFWIEGLLQLKVGIFPAIFPAGFETRRGTLILVYHLTRNFEVYVMAQCPSFSPV